MKTSLLCFRRSSQLWVRQTFTIPRRPYDSVRAVVSLCHPLFSTALAPREETCGCRSGYADGATPMASTTGDACHAAAMSFLDATAGAPCDPRYEGPFNREEVTSVRDYLTPDVVQYVWQQRLFRGKLVAAPHSWMAAMWDVPLQQHYTAALIQARAEVLQHRATTAKGTRYTLPRIEAGLTLRDVLARTHTADDAGGETAAAQRTRRDAWRRLIDDYTLILPDRSRVHEIENSPQEITIGEMVRDAASQLRQRGDTAWQPECVVDVGGGNGYLAAQVAEQLQCAGLVIDPHTPAHAIDCLPYYMPNVTDRQRPAQPRRQVLHRLQGFFEDVKWRDAVPASPDRTVLIAKHLCGSAIDQCLRRLHEQNSLPRIAVLAPCCFNKIQLDQYCDPAFLSHALSVPDQDALARLTRLTDWNMTCGQHVNEVHLHKHRDVNALLSHPRGDASQAHVAVPREGELVSVQSSSRYGGVRSVAYHVPCMSAVAQLVEGITNYGRVQWLRAHGYTHVDLVQYVPDCVTPKNKCIVAIRDA